MKNLEIHLSQEEFSGLMSVLDLGGKGVDIEEFI
jgi:hypothetical protein